jgi:hypothetical protein
VPGAPQPSPLDAGFSSMPGPWAGGELGRLDLAPLAPLPDPSAAALQPPELPSIQVGVHCVPHTHRQSTLLGETVFTAGPLTVGCAAVHGKEAVSFHDA